MAHAQCPQSDNLHAYLLQDSVTAALTQAMHVWLRELKPTVVPLVLADMSKAFSWVNRAKLMQHILDNELCPMTDWLAARLVLSYQGDGNG